MLNPDALLPDEPAVAAPALTLTEDTDEEDGEEVRRVAPPDAVRFIRETAAQEVFFLETPAK